MSIKILNLFFFFKNWMAAKYAAIQLSEYAYFTNSIFRVCSNEPAFSL